LVEQQKSLLEENERCLSAIEQLVIRSPVDSGAILREVSNNRETQSALLEVSHEIVMTQEFQDLCSQKVQKVMRLMGTLDGSLRALLTQLRLAPPMEGSPQKSSEDADIDQGAADDILKGFGI
jgi:chemotaxis regulatin CheY-phosphate phosphatase CheZ